MSSNSSEVVSDTEKRRLKNLYNWALETTERSAKLKEAARLKEEAEKIPNFRKTAAKKFHYRELEDLKQITLDEFTELEKEALAVREALTTKHVIKRHAGDIIFSVARCYNNGIQTALDLDKAIEWYELGNTIDHIPSKTNLAFLLLRTYPERAISLLKEAAELGNSFAQYLLGKCYLRNFAVQPCAENIMSAYNWLALAHKQFHPDAGDLIKECLKGYQRFGIPLPAPELELSIEDKLFDTYFVLTAKDRDQFVYTDPDILKEMSDKDFSEIEKTAHEELTDSQLSNPKLKLAFVRANFDIAQCHFHGLRGKKDYALVLEYCKKAYALDSVPAEDMLGSYYYLQSKGNVKQYRGAAIATNSDQKIESEKAKNKAKYGVVTKDKQTKITAVNNEKLDKREKAEAEKILAASQSSQDDPEDVKSAKLAYKYYCLAANKGFAKAQFHLARCYFNASFMEKVGAELESNSETGFSWLMKSALQKYRKAQILVKEYLQQKKAFVPAYLLKDDFPKVKIEVSKQKAKPSSSSSSRQAPAARALAATAASSSTTAKMNPAESKTKKDKVINKIEQVKDKAKEKELSKPQTTVHPRRLDAFNLYAQQMREKERKMKMNENRDVDNARSKKTPTKEVQKTEKNDKTPKKRK